MDEPVAISAGSSSAQAPCNSPETEQPSPEQGGKLAEAAIVPTSQVIVVRSGYRLSPTQEQVIQGLAGGACIADAARSAGVSRRTVHRWIQIDSRFTAALNSWREENQTSGRIRVEALSNLALDAVQGALKKGDARIGLQIARANGILAPSAPAPTSPKEIRRLRRLRKRLRNLREARRRLKLETAEAAYKKQIGQDDRWWEYDVEKIENHIRWYLECRHRALAKETPERRAERLDPIHHSGIRRVTSLLQQLDAIGIDFTECESNGFTPKMPMLVPIPDPDSEHWARPPIPPAKFRKAFPMLLAP